MKRQKSSRHRRRVLSLQAIFILLLGVVAMRLQVVQHVFGPGLLAQAKQAETVTAPLLAPRGEILDAQGQPLAYDITAYMMDVEVSQFPDKTQLTDILAKALGTSTSNVASLVDSAKAKEWIQFPNPVTEPQKEAIQNALNTLYSHAQATAKANGQNPLQVTNYPAYITFTQTEERVYPYGTFAANVIGYVNHQGVGESGLEEEYNKELSGTNGEIQYTVDGAGFPIQSSIKVIKPAKPGENIQTTIDGTIQGFVEQQMDQLVAKYKPQHAAIIVEDPNTGAILGMASRPTYNPNQYWNASAAALNTNWAVQSSFEPGSTFKLITLAAGLATNSIALNQTIMSGHITIGPNTIYDWNMTGWGQITFLKALEMSSNVGFATVALRTGWANMLHYMKAFGYLSKTGIDLPAEATSNVFPPSERGKIELATTGFGQGIAVTPMQQMQGVGAIANGGTLLKPFIVSKITNATTGKVVHRIGRTVVNPQVIPPSVDAQVKEGMVLDVSQGIDSVGALPGYEVAGKTGTAQVVDPETGQYYTDRYITSFIGYAPGWAPKYEVYVTVDWPKAPEDQTWGSTIATPPARNILQDALEYGHIAPRGNVSLAGSNAKAYEHQETYVTVPNVVGSSTNIATTTLKAVGLTGEVVTASSGNVTQQWPAAGTKVAKGTKVFVAGPKPSTKLIKMPDLTGATMSEANGILAALGLSMNPTGDGQVVAQSVSPGTMVAAGATIDVTLSGS